jgi:hypothetical protein
MAHAAFDPHMLQRDWLKRGAFEQGRGESFVVGGVAVLALAAAAAAAAAALGAQA